MSQAESMADRLCRDTGTHHEAIDVRTKHLDKQDT